MLANLWFSMASYWKYQLFISIAIFYPVKNPFKHLGFIHQNIMEYITTITTWTYDFI